MKTPVLPFVLLFALLVGLSNCQCTPPGPGDDDGGNGGGAGNDDGGNGGGQGSDGGADAGCSRNDQCGTGVCNHGQCCASAAQACADTCCPATTLCLFDRCVTPGKSCQTANDCAANQYCETLFGVDGGAPDAGHGDGGVCSSPVLINGRCVDLPPVCPPDGGALPDAGCVEACEYHPQAKPLDSVVRWTWGPVAREYPAFTDVWSTPAVGRIFDANCDGKLDELDPPNVVFVSGNALGTCCQCTGQTVSACQTGVLRLLDGRDGSELWSLAKASPSSSGFAGLSVAIGDLDHDGSMDIAAATGEGYVVVLNGDGTLKWTSDLPIPGIGNSASFGWGGGLAIADMNGDGAPEIAFGSTVFTTAGGALKLLFSGNQGRGGNLAEALSTFADLDSDGGLELLAGRTAYRADGGIFWNDTDGGLLTDGGCCRALTDGFSAVGDFDRDGHAEAVLVESGYVWLLDASTGVPVLNRLALSGAGTGGPPTVADFDGDGRPEIGVAQKDFYFVLKPNFGAHRLDILWQTPNHDFSSSVTGSTVFDFEGDKAAEVIYGDECFLWVFDGKNGDVRFATPNTSFTGTEASVVADVDGDGRAEILRVSNGADPSSAGWKCNIAPWNQPDPDAGRPAWKPPPDAGAYRGLTVFGDRANSWVGTRTLWNQHSYHVSNICDDRDSACVPASGYGAIPKVERLNWRVPWLNNFRQNVQDKGLFNAPDPTVVVAAECTDPVEVTLSVRNIGMASLPAGIEVGLFVRRAGTNTRVWKGATSRALNPGQTEQLVVTLPANVADRTDTFFGRILVDPVSPTFHECREDNNQSALVKAICIG